MDTPTIDEDVVLFICDHCGEPVLQSKLEEETADDQEACKNLTICYQCLIEDFTWCDECCNYVENDDMVEIHREFGINFEICRDCAESDRGGDFTWCSHCEEWWISSNMHDYDGGDECCCSNCLENMEINECSECGELVSERYTHWHHENAYCAGCFEEQGYSDDNDEEIAITCYHGFNAWVPRTTKPDEKLLFGFELEVYNKENNISNTNAATEVKRIMNQLVVCSYDGSIGDGFEIISHPMSYSYFLTQLDKIQEMLTYLRDKGFTSHNAGCCGLHIHVSREGLGCNSEERNNTINNALLLFENFMEEITIFSRRREADIARWSQFLSKAVYNTGDKLIGLKFVDDHKGTTNRYVAINLENKCTIEFRIFRGTLNFTSFMACFQFVNNLIEKSQHESIKGLTWKQLLGKDKEVREYNKIRGIESTIRAKEIIVRGDKKKHTEHVVDIPDEYTGTIGRRAVARMTDTSGISGVSGDTIPLDNNTIYHSVNDIDEAVQRAMTERLNMAGHIHSDTIDYTEVDVLETAPNEPVFHYDTRALTSSIDRLEVRSWYIGMNNIATVKIMTDIVTHISGRAWLSVKIRFMQNNRVVEIPICAVVNLLNPPYVLKNAIGSWIMRNSPHSMGNSISRIDFVEKISGAIMLRLERERRACV